MNQYTLKKKTTNDYLISALAARERPAGAQSHYPILTLVIVEIGILLYTIGKRSAIAWGVATLKH
jgi:hypothetical protein